MPSVSFLAGSSDHRFITLIRLSKETVVDKNLIYSFFLIRAGSYKFLINLLHILVFYFQDIPYLLKGKLYRVTILASTPSYKSHKMPAAAADSSS